MKKLLLTLVAAAAMWFPSLAVADSGTTSVPVKMTYVNNDDPYKAYGEITEGETAIAGYNKVGSTVGWANSGWGVNYVTYLQVDASAIEGTIINATLSFDASGSTDSKRNTGWQVGYNSSTWTSEMTAATADYTITTMGDVVWGTSKSATTFENLPFDISNAFKESNNGVVTIVVCETNSAGGYIKNPKVEVVWTTEASYNITFKETNGVNATVKIDGNDVTTGTSLIDGTYSFTATAPHYEDYKGEFSVNGSDKNVEFTMTLKKLLSFTIKNNVNDNVQTGTCYEGESTKVPYSKYIIDADGTVWKKDAAYGDKNQEYNFPFSATKDYDELTLDYTKTDMTDGILFIEGEDIEGMESTTNGNAGVRGSNAHGGFANEAVAICSLKPGIYIVKMGIVGNKNKTLTIKAGENEILTATTQGWWEEKVSEAFSLNEETTLTCDGATDSAPLDYILITGEEKSVANYTIKFVDEEGNDLKDPIEGTGFIGDPIEISDEDKADITKGEYKYTFVSIEPENPTVEANGEVTVKFKKIDADKLADYIINFVDKSGKDLKAPVTLQGTIGEEIDITEYTDVIIADGKIYEFVSVTYSPEGNIIEKDGKTVTLTFKSSSELPYERAQSTWTDVDLTDWVNDNSAVSQTINGGLNVMWHGSTVKSSWNSTKAIELTPNSIVTLKASINGGGAPGHESSYTFLGLGDVQVRLYGNPSKAFVAIGGEETLLDGYTRGGNYDFEIIVNQATKNVNVSVSGNANGTVTGKISESLPSEVIFGHYRGGNEGNWDTTDILKAIEISEEIQDIKMVDYTVNYICNGTPVKTETGSIAVGAEISVTAPLNIDGQKYYFAEGASTTMIIKDGTNVLDVQLREANVYNYTVTNNVNLETITGTCVEGETETVPFSRYIIADNNVVWMKSVGDTQSYIITVAPDKDDYETSIEYTQTDMTDGIFFKEAEDEYYDGVLTPAATAGNRGSNYKGGYASGAAVLYKLQPGTYNFKFAGLSSSSTKATLVLKAGEEEILSGPLDTKFKEFSTESPITISEETDLTIEGTDGNNVLDYILITGKVPQTYTINFVDVKETDETKKLIKTETRNGIVGEAITLDEEYTKDFVKDNITYVYESNDAEGKKVAADGSTVVTLNFHKKAEVSYTVKFVDQDGNEIKPDETRNDGDAGSPVTISEDDKNIVVDGVTYVYASDDSEGKTYQYNNSTVVTITYNKVVSYTVKFVDESGVEIKTAETYNGAIGSEITLPDDYQDPIYFDGQRYIYVSNDLVSNPTITADGTIVTITYRLPQIGEVYTIVDETFVEGQELTKSAKYSWGEEIQGMIKANGLYVTNNSDKANNYENRDFVTFTNSIGNANSEINVSYEVYSPKDKGQANTYYDIKYFNNEGEFVFGIQEASGNWGYTANIITANADGTTNTAELPAGHMSKGGGSTVELTVKFFGENALIMIDGGNYVASTKNVGIGSVKLSVSGVSGEDRDMYIKNYVVKTKEISEKYAYYNLKYVAGNKTLKEISKIGVVGEKIALASNETADFFLDDIKYIYDSNDAAEQTITAEGNTVVTLNFHVAAEYNYTVKNNVNSDVVTGSVLEGEDATVAYSRYILDDDGKVWKKDPCGGDKKLEYNYTFTPDDDNFEVTLDYTVTDMTNGIFYAEAEDLKDIFTPTSGNNAKIRCSNAAGGYSSEAVGIYTLQPGTYKVAIGVWGGTNNTEEDATKNVDFIVKAGKEKTVLTRRTNGSWGEAVSDVFTVETETDLTFEGADASHPLDYILIWKANIPATGITLEESKTLVYGETVTLAATVTPANTTDAISWSSSDEKIATVDEDGTVTAIGIGTATITATCGEFTATCVITCYAKLGDADGDGIIAINDAINIANYVLEDYDVPEDWKGTKDEWLEFFTKAADVNKDGNISISDASAAVSLALKADLSNPSQTRVSANYDAADNLVIGGITTANGKTSVAVTLDNSTDFVAVQADIFMPEGVYFDVKPGSRIANSHSFQTKRFDDNHIRVVIYTFNGTAFADNNEPIFEIVADSYLSSQSDIAIVNILASDSKAKSFALGSRYDDSTGLAAHGFDSNAPVKVYDLNGRYISDKVEGLEQGFYIIRQGDNAKKVRVR